METDNLDLVHQAIQTGERSRVLFELLLAEIGMSYENTRGEVFDKLKQTQEDYENAIKTLTMVIKAQSQTVGVS